ncbi:MAG: dihydroorotate dehydrogenase electron transfer subunit [Oscillospiraceae bacterium]|nr:dihydroorotate dehydrogenase electron transfer subunit [Oscillospiraceae bacterium]
MKIVDFMVDSQINLTGDVLELTLEGDTSAITAPGQFVNVKLDGFFLRRPISVCDWTENTLRIIYKVVGKGTDAMVDLQSGDLLELLTGLGNGYNLEKSGDAPLLLGGGVGVPPLYGLAKRLRAQGKDVTAVLGFNTQKEVFYEKQFAALGVKTIVTTADGSYGEKGFVTTPMEKLDYSYFYTCGPMPMLRAVNAAAKTAGQFSFEERMGCGFGACMGCTCQTKNGAKRICKEGPVLEREEIQW